MLMLGYVSIKSQSWCAPNAVWYFSLANGHTKHTFTGTTTINNTICQKIDYVGNGWILPFMGTLTPYTFQGSYYSRQVNNVVFLLDQTSNQFDTLYNFNATIGSKWSLPNKSTLDCANSRVTVLDTGRNNVQGVSLKWFKVNVKTFSLGLTLTSTTIDTIYERIGFLKFYPYEVMSICPPQTDTYPKGGALYCYSDNQITSFKRTNLACNYVYVPTTGLSESAFSKATIWCTPNSKKVTISLQNASNCKIQISNLIGQHVITQMITEPITEIDANKLNAGVYVVKLFKENKLVTTKKLIIE